jgi:Anti-sigma factor NepR
MWDQLLKGRAGHPRRGYRPVPAGSAAPGNGKERERMLRLGMATCIGERLRASYVGLIREPVPERFMDILHGPAESQTRTDDLDRDSEPDASLRGDRAS